MKHFRKTAKETLRRIDYELQDQAFDHVLRSDERQVEAFHDVFEYVVRNPERTGLVPVDGYSRYKFSGCLVPGYPQLRPFDDSFWNEFNRVISYLRANGMFRSPKE